MNDAFEIAAIGLSAQQRALDVAANNVANLSTPGFKRGSIRFSEALAAPANTPNPIANLQNTMPGGGVRTEEVVELGIAGEIVRTNNSLDLAIDGKGFLEVLSPDGRALLWRGGTLAIRDGLLSTSNGYPLRASIGAIPQGSDIRISPNGIVTAHTAEGASAELGSLALVEVDDIAQLQRLEGGLYAPHDAQQIRDMNSDQTGAGVFIQGGLEQSNVSLNEEMVRLMMIQRMYAANSQIVQAADQIAAMANNLKE